jgi:hypothetical protein
MSGYAQMEDEEPCFPKLTYKQRLTGFLTCLTIGFILELFAWITLVSLFKGKPAPFAIFYTSGNIAALLSTCFLAGFKRQCKSMFAKKRWIASLCYLMCIVLTLVAAVVLKNPILTLLFLVLQFIAMGWYVLTYIPFGTTLARKCAGLCV